VQKKQDASKIRKRQKSRINDFEEVSFLFFENKIKKITSKIEDSNSEEVSKVVEAQKGRKEVSLSPKVFELTKSVLGDFEIIL
jgi:hypothetical protein